MCSAPAESCVVAKRQKLMPQAVTSGANPVNIKRGIDKTCAFLVERLKELSVPVSGTNDIRSVASISAGNDSAIGAMIADALDKVRPLEFLQFCLVVQSDRLVGLF